MQTKKFTQLREQKRNKMHKNSPRKNLNQLKDDVNIPEAINENWQQNG